MVLLNGSSFNWFNYVQYKGFYYFYCIRKYQEEKGKLVGQSNCKLKTAENLVNIFLNQQIVVTIRNKYHDL